MIFCCLNKLKALYLFKQANKFMETLVIKTEGQKLKALLQVLKALEIPFMRSEFPELDKKIKKAREEKIKGELRTVNPDNIWENIS